MLPADGHPHSAAVSAFLVFVLLVVFSLLIAVALHWREVAHCHTFNVNRMGMSHVCLFFFSNNGMQHYHHPQPNLMSGSGQTPVEIKTGLALTETSPSPTSQTAWQAPPP